MTEYIPEEKAVPLVDIAVENILARFEDEGYGAILLHSELKKWMGIKKAETTDEVKKEQMDYMLGTCKIRDKLLENYNLYIHSSIGYGYKILHPSEQLRQGADYYLSKAQKALIKHGKTLSNIDESELTIDDKQLRLNKIGRLAFVKSAFRKRSLPQQKNRKLIK